MQIRVGLENGIEGRSLAWVFDNPGCFAYGTNSTEAIMRVPQAVITYHEWIGSHTKNSWLEDLEDFDVALAEIFEWFTIQQGEKKIEVNAWFQEDTRPLSAAEIERGLFLLEWSNIDLLSLITPLHRHQLDQKFPGERWSIDGVVRHVANANWWYFDRIGLSGVERDQLSGNIIERINQVHLLMNEALPSLAGNNCICEVDGETWSPRKVLRRAVWHMRDHHFHIERLLTLL